MITCKVSGIEAVQAELRQIAEKVPENGRKQMHRMADRIVKQAKLNAPVDKHNLEEAIHKEVTYDGTQGGRLQIDVVAGGMVGDVNVDDYAAEMHEHYPENNPGPGTQAKREALPGVHVGGGYLQRAVDAERPYVEDPNAVPPAVFGATETPTSFMRTLLDLSLKVWKVFF